MAATPEFLRMPFKEALEYFKSKSVFPTENSRQFMAEQHDFAFTVAGLTKADLLSDTKFLIEEAIEKGNDFEIFKDQFKKLVAKKGWQPGEGRLETIMDVNVRRSHAAGRYQQATSPEMMQNRKWWIWRHRDSVVPRPLHLALDNKAIPATHDFWKIATPSCAYRCRCTFFTANERTLERMGAAILENPPDPKTIAEPGFQRAAGSSPKSDRAQILADGLARLSPDLRRKVKSDLRKKKISI